MDKAGETSTERKNTVINKINLCTNFDLQDVWRLQLPKTSQYTWHNNSLKVQCRLDYWLVSKELSVLVTNSGIVTSTISDHSAVTLHLQSKEYVQRGPSFRKINNSLLSDEKSVQDHSSEMPEFKTKHDYLDDKGLHRDMIKMEVKGFCVQYAKTGTPKYRKAPHTTNRSFDEPGKD